MVEANVVGKRLHIRACFAYTSLILLCKPINLQLCMSIHIQVAACTSDHTVARSPAGVRLRESNN